MIVITGRVTARPGSFDLLKAEGLAHSARSRGEDGCLSHRCYVDAAEPDVLSSMRSGATWRRCGRISRTPTRRGS